MIWEEGGTDISRLPVTPFNTVINPDVTNWWPGAGEFLQPPRGRAFYGFSPTRLSWLDCHSCVLGGGMEQLDGGFKNRRGSLGQGGTWEPSPPHTL